VIHQWLKAGVLEDGAVTHPESGTSQGGVMPPSLTKPARRPLISLPRASVDGDGIAAQGPVQVDAGLLPAVRSETPRIAAISRKEKSQKNFRSTISANAGSTLASSSSASLMRVSA
jgi:hypothetical protein